jgi:hypothetical protein
MTGAGGVGEQDTKYLNRKERDKELHSSLFTKDY